MPVEIRDELALLRYARLQNHIPILYATLIAVVSMAMLAAAQDAPWLVRLGIPLFVAGAGITRMLWWMRQKSRPVTADQARERINTLTLISTGIAGLCSIWCLLSWMMSDPVQQSYYPLFMAMGSLTTTFCLAAIRKAAVLNLTCGILPICVGMAVFGGRMDVIAALIMLAATAFLARLVMEQHEQLVDLLMLKHQLREQANTDPLTGLLNRRALITEAASAFVDPDATPALVLIDLDGFKAVNDSHGHAAGDELLVQIAQRLQDIVGGDGGLARLGGDEFALLIPKASDDGLRLLTDRLLLALVPAFGLTSARITVGASAGKAIAPGDGTSLASLFAAADRALYAAKGARNRTRNRGQSDRRKQVA